MSPDLATWAALVEDYRLRAADLAEFEERIADDPPKWNERNWQAFFRRDPWIFGHGLDYTLLVNEAAVRTLRRANPRPPCLAVPPR